ncbi:Hydroxyacylglutathione hydrolase [subsurface metagenome]
MDHVGGIGKAIKQMPNATVVVHRKGKPHLVDPAKLWEGSQQTLGELALKYGPIEPVPPDRILIAEDGMKINLGEVEIEVLSTPGHAPHHLSFLDRNEGRLFVGEAAGSYTEGVDAVRPATPPPSFNLEQALSSLDKLIRLAPRSLCYAHFGCAAGALDRLRYYKQQLILWGSLIADHLEEEASWQDMCNEIQRRDDVLARINTLPSEQCRREFYFIKNSIRGFVDYFKRYGTEYIKQYDKEPGKIR